MTDVSEEPVSMNPFRPDDAPNYWLSCLIIEPEAMCRQVRGEQEALYISKPRKSCPTEILEALAAFNTEEWTIWKPMHMQPIYRMNPFITSDGSGRGRSNAYIRETVAPDIGADIFQRGLCLPSDNKMTEKQQDTVIRLIRQCFA